MAILTPQQCEQLGRCHHCEHHPPTQGHHLTCPTRWRWRGGGTQPIDWPPELPPDHTPSTAETTRADTPAPTPSDALTLDL